MDELVKVQNLTKIFKSGLVGGYFTTAVDDVSFDIHRSEIISLVGESGSGKTTVGRLILRLLKLSTGKIIYEGVDISTLKGRKLRDYYKYVQGVFQDPFASFNPIFKVDRVFDLLFDSYLKDKTDKKHELIVESLEKVGLNSLDILGKYPHQMSGGQLQRILIARTLLLDTKLLIADELISMLDASTRVDVLNLLGDLRDKEKMSVLFITHDLSLGYYISDTTMIMYRGNIVEFGKTKLVFDNPLHPYTRMLLSAVPEIGRKWKKSELEMKRGEIPAGGCPYFDRCPLAMDVCRKKPNLKELEKDHKVACYAAEVMTGDSIQIGKGHNN
ncbi:ABC transporter ATP-binding protein [Athalassotoga saccharophila]|uniref:ABC transporter ATP-binding protein n=1 Tax=Athalassotoga saccharophila TaxID=1441386 RepID=UPI001379DF73|nr:ABC transporter ATP-binding protein [Athalassotoga saccharophila]BBJ28994.1 oligopeptide transport ATP-binding protein OppF [Athalassotoga saccharophila]